MKKLLGEQEHKKKNLESSRGKAQLKKHRKISVYKLSG